MVLPSCIDRSRLGPPLCVAAAASLVACVRPSLPRECPAIAAGDLVLTELRGSQSGSYSQWLELYNASDEPIELAGLAVYFRPQDDGEAIRFLVRDPDLVAEPGAYVVLGGGSLSTEDYLDYDYTGDWDSSAGGPIDLKAGGFYDVQSCDVLIDRVLVRTLPAEGTRIWPGEPDAAANDDTEAGWCTDDVTEIPSRTGKRGTPGEVNPACPPPTEGASS
mgnify:CR=1 FL=1